MPVNADVVFGGILLVGHGFMIAVVGFGVMFRRDLGARSRKRWSKTPPRQALKEKHSQGRASTQRSLHYAALRSR
jgi:hypothetical protein